MKLFKKIKIGEEREICLLGFPLIQYRKKMNKLTKRKQVSIFPKSFEHRVCDLILNQIPSGHDLIIIARAGLGEAYILNFMLRSIISKHKAKKPCIVATKKHYSEVFKMYSPEIPFYGLNINNYQLSRSILHRTFKYKNIIFNSNPSTFYEISNYFTSCEKKLNGKHYLDVLKDFCGIKEFELKPQNFPDNIDVQIKNKFPNLNFDKFIYIIPEANFIKKIDTVFWTKLYELLKTKGYDIFINSPEISITEATYLAKKSKAIIALRCGFSEILSGLNLPMHILYTDCSFHNISNLKDILTLSKYPNINNFNLHEYSVSKTNYNEIVESIISKL